MTHTPGPWKIGKFSKTSVVAGKRLVANTGGFQSNFEDTLPANLANARLVAAAPELLGALRELIADYEEIGGPHFFDDNYKIAGQLIAKVKGEK